MNNSLKIGIISGFIAGIVSAIVLQFFIDIALSLGLYDSWWRENVLCISNIPILIPLLGFWGIIFGIIYSKVYDIIPKKGIWKGLIYGLFIWFITVFRIMTYVIPYGQYLNAAGEYFSYIFSAISFGLVLGILYEFLGSRYYPIKEKLKIMTYDMKSGILPGAIAGLVGGIGASFANVIGLAIIGFFKIPGFPAAPTLDMWISQAGSHTVINLFWGTIFGVIFTRVYNLIPRKGVLKGIIYSLTIFLLNSFQLGIYWFGWGLNDPSIREVAIFMGEWTIFVGFFNAFFFGLVLGLIYKPTK